MGLAVKTPFSPPVGADVGGRRSAVLFWFLDDVDVDDTRTRGRRRAANKTCLWMMFICLLLFVGLIWFGLV